METVVQTWLPYPNYAESARVLDTRRLSRQRVEVVEIMDVLHEVNQQSEYYDHPVIEMWRGYEPQLCEYGMVMCEEYQTRNRTRAGKIVNTRVTDLISWHLDCATSGEFTLSKPPWFGDVQLHLSHQSNLVRENPDHYWKFFSGVPNDLPVIWPTV